MACYALQRRAMPTDTDANGEERANRDFIRVRARARELFSSKKHVSNLVYTLYGDYSFITLCLHCRVYDDRGQLASAMFHLATGK